MLNNVPDTECGNTVYQLSRTFRQQKRRLRPCPVCQPFPSTYISLLSVQLQTLEFDLGSYATLGKQRDILFDLGNQNLDFLGLLLPRRRRSTAGPLGRLCYRGRVWKTSGVVETCVRH